MEKFFRQGIQRLNAKEQRKLKAIKKARLLGLLPFTDKHKIEEKK